MIIESAAVWRFNDLEMGGDLGSTWVAKPSEHAEVEDLLVNPASNV